MPTFGNEAEAAGLDPGSTHDWVRAVLDEPSGRTR